jgi:tetratricopeptide (TPR) repeat protein
LKPRLIFACGIFLCCGSLLCNSLAQEVTQNPQAPSANDLPGRLEAAMDARKSGDPAAIGRASRQVIALGLVQMAKIRLDGKAYDEAVKLCADSLEFEDTPETRVELAIANLYAKKPSDALKQASTAIEMDPQNALAWTIKGQALLRTEDYSGAAAALQRSIELKQDAEPLYSLGMAQLAMGEKQEAAQSFSRMLALVGDYGWSRVLVGRAYQEQKLAQDAVAEFQNALRLDPRTPNAHYSWALTLLKANDWTPTPEAQSQLKEELKLNPHHLLANYLLGVFASIARNYEESDRYLHFAAQLDPALPEVWMYLGLNANDRRSGRFAETYLRKAIALKEKGNPQEHLSLRKAYIALGRILLASDRKSEGEALLQKAREMQVEDLTQRQQKVASIKTKEGTGVSGAVEPEIPETDNQKALFVRPGQSPEGRDTFLEGHHLAGSPKDPAGKTEIQLRTVLGSSFNDLATAEALQEKYDLALKHYREAANWDARIPGLQRNLGLAAFFAGQPSEAIRLLSKEVVQTPGDSHARAVLGMAYCATQNFTRAAQTIAPIANQALQDPQLGFAWAKSLAKTGDKRRAARALQGLEKANANLTVDSLIQFGQLWQELGEADRGAHFFRQVLLMDPENTAAKCGLHLADCP